MELEEAIRLVDRSTRPIEIVKYNNLKRAYDEAAEALVEASRRSIEAGINIYNDILANNLDDGDDELVVLEISKLKDILLGRCGVKL